MMFNTDIFEEVRSWKKPLHKSRNYIAKNYLKLLPEVEVIGITGSVGKTLTQNAIYSVLSQKFNVATGGENLDPTFRIPQTILATKPWNQKVVLEYGVEKPGNMDHYLSIVKPKIAVVTTISPTHTKYFKDIEGIYSEKVKLVKALGKSGYAVLNADDPNVTKMANETEARIYWYGKKAADGVKISHFSQSLTGSTFRLHYKSQKATVSWKAVGEHQLTSAYAAAAVGLLEGLTLKQIAKGLSQVKLPVHRLTPLVTKNFNIIDDTYNSSPKAALEALKTFLKLSKNLHKIIVLGPMKDLGHLSLEEHKKLGSAIAKSKINVLITYEKVAEIIGKSAKKYGFVGRVLNSDSTQEIIKEIKKLKKANSVILIKGSRHAHLERVVNGLLGKSTKLNCYHCGNLK
ncbi:MAG: Mur ligase family protein [Candidatus Curtissbacteria bacterium]|nr:Mur ligase family protein [Candidatus Curtissbacteria bacterium]